MSKSKQNSQRFLRYKQKCNFSSIRSVKNRLVIAAKLTFVVLNVVVLSLFIRSCFCNSANFAKNGELFPRVGHCAVGE